MAEPIACSLTHAEAVKRAEQTAALARRSLRSRRALGDGERLCFAGDAETEGALAEVVAAESECCPFLDLHLRRVDDRLELDITGPGEAGPIIAALFA